MSDATTDGRMLVGGLRRLLEVGVLVAVGYWGYATGSGPARIGLTIGAPLAVVVVWGVLGSPKASRRLGEPLRGLLTLSLFGVGAGALWAVGQSQVAGWFAAMALVTTVADYWFDAD